jgi:hypothetical protein
MRLALRILLGAVICVVIAAGSYATGVQRGQIRAGDAEMGSFCEFVREAILSWPTSGKPPRKLFVELDLEMVYVSRTGKVMTVMIKDVRR